LGIPQVGIHAAELLVEKFPSMEKLVHAEFDELSDIPQIGPVIADSVCQFFTQDDTIQILEKLKQAGVRLVKDHQTNNSEKLSGLKFIFTGSLTHCSRFDAQEIVKSMGAKVASSISKNLDYVVVGKDPGSKLEKAKKLGLKIISEDEFQKLIKT